MLQIFHRPIAIVLVLLLPLLAWRLWRAPKPAVPFGSVDFAAGISPTLRQRILWLPAALRLLTLLLLIIAFAGPREGRHQTTVDAEGIAIELVVDRSGSMRAMDFQKEDQHVDRLTAVKDVAGRFVLGDETLTGRFSDLVGLVTFAGMADGVTPPTLDHAFLVAQLNETQIAQRRSEDGTAIGDAIGLAVEKLEGLDKHRDEQIKSKIIILLTDGENTAGTLDPSQAADLAKMLGIKVYTIGVGTKGRAPVPLADPFTGRLVTRWMDVNIDEKTLQSISQKTNAKYFRATDTQSLENVYAEIDRLERTRVEEQHFVDYRELAVQPIYLAGVAVPPITAWALVLLGLQLVLKYTMFREFSQT